MQIKFLLGYLTTYFLFLFSHPSLAQKETPLSVVLDSLEEKFDVKFSYSVENVKSVNIIPPDLSNSLNVILSEISTSTGLEFKDLESRYIAILKTKREKSGSFSFCGHVLNAESQLPVEDVVIAFQNGYTITNDEGFFSFPFSESSVQIQTYHLSFERLSINLQSTDGNCITLNIKPALSKLDEIIVRDYVTMGVNKRADGSMQLDSRHLGIIPGLPESDLLFTIQTLPGIQSIDESISDINVRGGTNDQNLVLWNGIRMFQTGHFFGLISAFNPRFTPNMEIIKDGTSASYGEAASSTLSFYSDIGIPDKPMLSLGSNLLYADGMINIPISTKASFKLGGRKSFYDTFNSPTYKSLFKRAFKFTDVLTDLDQGGVTKNVQDFDFYDLNVQFTVTPNDREHLNLNLIAISNGIENREGLDSVSQDTKISTLDQNSLGMGLNYRRSWTSNLLSEVLITFSKYNLSSRNFDIPQDLELKQENGVIDYGLKIVNRYRVNNAVDLSFGYQFEEVGIENKEIIVNPDFERIIKNVNEIHSIFGETNVGDKSGKSRLRVGLRTSWFSRNNRFRLEPRLVFNRQLIEKVNVEILGELKSQSAVQVIDLQSDFLGVEKRRWELSNDSDIPIISSKQISTAFTYGEDSNLITLGGYYKVVDGVITSSQGFLNQFERIRTIGSYEVTGVEFLATKRLSPLNLWIRYNLSRNSYRFSDLRPFRFSSNLDIRHYLYFGSSASVGNFNFSQGITFRTGRPVTEPNSTQPVLDDRINFSKPNQQRTPNYFRWDLSATYRVILAEKARLNVGISIWNVLDRRNVLDQYYLLQNDEIRKIEREALSIMPNLTLRIEI